MYDDSGVDYLYTKVTGVWRCMVNGFVTVVNGPFMSYRFTGGQVDYPGGTQPGGVYGANTARVPPNSPVASDGIGPSPPRVGIDDPHLAGLSFPPLRTLTRDTAAPVVTHRSVRHRLSTPAGKLYVFTGPGKIETGNDSPPPEFLSLESPEPGRPCDCKNGPFPRVLSMPEVMAKDNTLLVDFAVETFVNESQLNNVQPSGILLSHRFSQSHGLTDDYRTVISTRGAAIFRTDLVYAIPQNPDYLRRVLFMPIPQGFVRSIPVVRGREDVTGVEYEYQDTQQAVNFVAAPYCRAAKISALHRQVIVSDGDVLGGALDAYERVLGLAAYRNWAKQEQPPVSHPTPERPSGSAPGTGRPVGKPRPSRPKGKKP